ncbi:MAG: helix-turn-helix transcriptional regulator [Candidatus Hadarchaeota archaeon]
MPGKEESITNMAKFYTLLMLKDGPKHGYDLMGELEKRTGKKPSAGQIYPLLQKLEKKHLISHKAVMISGRRRKIYTLTSEGRKTSEMIIRRFSDVISIVLEPKLTQCAHCGCKVYAGGHEEKVGGKTLMFCCVHCAKSYKKETAKLGR